MGDDLYNDTTNVKIVKPTTLSGGRPIFQVKVAEVALCLDIDHYHSWLLHFNRLWLHDHGGSSVDWVKNSINFGLHNIHNGGWVHRARIVTKLLGVSLLQESYSILKKAVAYLLPTGSSQLIT